MFFPKCTKCGSKTESTEAGEFDQHNATVGRWLMAQRMTGHSHPYLQIAKLGVTLGREIYKRVPGGGEKRCTNPECGHRFH